ncbi:MAG TPA: nascent polypeptide-associated complex protein [Candidatus Micrarchaeota archaeon]|nr:nascent polypeptide-associated complex protein [Candidatus Micrarchaeota archaeon]
MIGGMDPRQMKRMMAQMGIDSTEVPATKVTIETDSEKIVILNPQVTEIKMNGESSFQIAGKAVKEAAISKDDLALVREQTGATEENALQAIKEANGDIALAIMKLKGE